MSRRDEEDSGESDESSRVSGCSFFLSFSVEAVLTCSPVAQELSHSESVDPSILGRGFDGATEDDDVPGVRQLDDETQESEDWAERDLRELRTHVAQPAPGRRCEAQFFSLLFVLL